MISMIYRSAALFGSGNSVMLATARRFMEKAMNKTLLAVALAAIMLNGCATSRGTPVTTSQNEVASSVDRVCMLHSALPANVQLTVLGQVEGSKEFYGSVTEILPLMADEARKMGADAVINLDTHQRMGLFAWARPVGTGTAVKLVNKSELNCLAAGGTFY